MPHHCTIVSRIRVATGRDPSRPKIGSATPIWDPRPRRRRQPAPETTPIRPESPLPNPPPYSSSLLALSILPPMSSLWMGSRAPLGSLLLPVGLGWVFRAPSGVPPPPSLSLLSLSLSLSLGRGWTGRHGWRTIFWATECGFSPFAGWGKSECCIFSVLPQIRHVAQCATEPKFASSRRVCKNDAPANGVCEKTCLTTVRACLTKLLARADIPAQIRVLSRKIGAKLKHTRCVHTCKTG